MPFWGNETDKSNIKHTKEAGGKGRLRQLQAEAESLIHKAWGNHHFQRQHVDLDHHHAHRGLVEAHTNHARRLSSPYASGSFTLAFGPCDVVVPGTVSVTTGSSAAVTSVDLSAYLQRGDDVSVGGTIYKNHPTNAFTATSMPL